MKISDENIIKEAGKNAAFCLYSYLYTKVTPRQGQTLAEIISDLEQAYAKDRPTRWSSRDIHKLITLGRMAERDPGLTSARIGDMTSKAFCFTDPMGEVSAVFCGTGKGEWLDNGEGLAGEVIATEAQQEALDWFDGISADPVTVTGHSKGGNKAQFVCINRPSVKRCFSFDGQGFAPESIEEFKKIDDFENRRMKLYSLCADNDYVNPLGEILVPGEHIYYFESDNINPHHMEAMLDRDGYFNEQTGAGVLSRYVTRVSRILMGLEPSLRRYPVMAVMDLFRRYYAKDTGSHPAEGGHDTALGLILAASLLILGI